MNTTNGKSTICRIILVRHGESLWNVGERKIQGHTDVPLTENGIQQVEDLAKSFRAIHIDKIFSSDLMRAKHTAEIIAREKKQTVEITPLIRERKFGKHLEGKPSDLRFAIEKIINRLSDEEKLTYKHTPDYESTQELLIRVKMFLHETTLSHKGKTVLVVTHDGIIRAFLDYIGFASIPRGSVSNTAYVELHASGTGFTVNKTKGISLP